MNRRELREHTFKLVFHLEFHELEDMPIQLQYYFDDLTKIEEKDKERIKKRYKDIECKLEKIDEKISTVAKGWTLGRMGKVDLSLIRLAVYEMLYDEEVPVGVAINEAIELAKIFGQDGSSSFVNGLLAKVLLLDEPLERNEI